MYSLSFSQRDGLNRDRPPVQPLNNEIFFLIDSLWVTTKAYCKEPLHECSNCRHLSRVSGCFGLLWLCLGDVFRNDACRLFYLCHYFVLFVPTSNVVRKGHEVSLALFNTLKVFWNAVFYHHRCIRQWSCLKEFIICKFVKNYSTLRTISLRFISYKCRSSILCSFYIMWCLCTLLRVCLLASKGNFYLYGTLFYRALIF